MSNNNNITLTIARTITTTVTMTIAITVIITTGRMRIGPHFGRGEYIALYL